MTAATPSPIPTREFFLPGQGAHGRTGLLLVHGLAGTPNEMRQLGRSFQSAGFEVHGVQLAGHCAGLDDLVATHWQDWAGSVHAAAQRLRARVDKLVVVGLSMGAVLALALLPAAQGQGLGSAVLRRCQAEAGANLWATVAAFHEPARRFYQRGGFQEVGELEGLIADSESEILLRWRVRTCVERGTGMDTDAAAPLTDEHG